MRILYFIGNGLDVSLGMKTRYPDFYDYYCSLDENMQDRDVIRLRNSIEQGKEELFRWIRLMKYINRIATISN